MARLKAFQYIVLKHPDVNDDTSTESTSVLIDGSNELLLAQNAEVAMIQIARKLPDSELVNLDRIEFLVRPF